MYEHVIALDVCYMIKRPPTMCLAKIKIIKPFETVIGQGEKSAPETAPASPEKEQAGKKQAVMSVLCYCIKIFPGRMFLPPPPPPTPFFVLLLYFVFVWLIKSKTKRKEKKKKKRRKKKGKKERKKKDVTVMHMLSAALPSLCTCSL